MLLGTGIVCRQSAGAEIKWLASVHQARAQALEKHLPVVVQFVASDQLHGFECAPPKLPQALAAKAIFVQCMDIDRSARNMFLKGALKSKGVAVARLVKADTGAVHSIMLDHVRPGRPPEELAERVEAALEARGFHAAITEVLRSRNKDAARALLRLARQYEALDKAGALLAIAEPEAEDERAFWKRFRDLDEFRQVLRERQRTRGRKKKMHLTSKLVEKAKPILPLIEAGTCDRLAGRRFKLFMASNLPGFSREECLALAQRLLAHPDCPADFLDAVVQVTARDLREAGDKPGVLDLLEKRLAHSADLSNAVVGALLAVAPANSREPGERELAARWQGVVARAAHRNALLQELLEFNRAAAGWRERTRQTRKAADVVVLVPDEPTFCYWISRWNARTFFPVLFAEPHYALRFILAYKPKQIILAEPWRGARDVTQELVWEALGLSRTDVDMDWQAEAALKVSPSPDPGIVVTHPGHPACCGALALAAGRGQDIVFYASARRQTAAVGYGEFKKIEAGLRAAIAQGGHHVKGWGKDIDFVTIATDVPMYLNGGGVITGRLAVDDGLGRQKDGVREFWVGRLLPNRDWAAYAAACSMFLPADRVLLFSRYSLRGEWGRYRVDDLAGRLATERKVEQRTGARASLTNWRRLTQPRNRWQTVWINSSGGATSWSLSKGGGRTDDVPDTLPTIVHKIHSGSAANVFNPDTLAGRWIHNGAYIYFGAEQEPYLSAFKPPERIWRELSAGMPLVAAFRKRRGIFSMPWKLAYFGDPLRGLTNVAERGRVSVALEGGRLLAQVAADLRESGGEDEDMSRPWLALYLLGRHEEAAALAGRHGMVKEQALALEEMGRYDKALDALLAGVKPDKAVSRSRRLLITRVLQKQLFALSPDGRYPSPEAEGPLAKVVAKVIGIGPKSYYGEMLARLRKKTKK